MHEMAMAPIWTRSCSGPLLSSVRLTEMGGKRTPFGNALDTQIMK